MTNNKMQLFLSEIAHQCGFAIIAEADLLQAYQNIVNDDFPRKNFPNQMSRFWYSAQALLVTVANISKLLWPYDKSDCRTREDGEELRKYLEVDDSSPLKSKRMRNLFEHYDERIAKLPENGSGYIDSSILRVSDSNLIKNAIYLRNFNPTNLTITFQDEVFELEPVMDAVKILNGKLDNKKRRR